LGVAGAVVVGAAAPALAAITPGALSLSATQGPSNGGNMITATTSVGAPAFFPGVDVEFQAIITGTASSTCAPVYATPVTPTSTAGGILDVPNPLVISVNRLAIYAPNFGSAPSAAKYNVCVYSTSTSAGQLLAQTPATAQYTIGTRVGLNNVWPVSGASQGGSTITVYGSSFPTATTTTGASVLTATLGGLPLLNISVVSPTAFTATTSPHSPSTTPVALVVSTPSGISMLGKAFTYLNGITVAPNTAPSLARNGGTPIDVQGIGFAALNFAYSGNPDDANSHVYLVKGVYDPTVAGGGKRNGELTDCSGATVVSDTELVCTLSLQETLSSSGANAGTSVVSTRTINATTATDLNLTSISPALSQADRGERISGTNIAAGSTIATVATAGTSATVSLPTSNSGAVTGLIVGLGNLAATVTAPNPNNPNPGAPVTAISPALSQADVGKVITGTGIAPGTTIVGLGDVNGTSAYLSAPTLPSATGSSGTIMVGDAFPVTGGPYTLTIVSNGAPGAPGSDSTYSQSVMSSGATFTVADF
jgi:hypothetical protein